MGIIELLLIAVGLSMDAFAVSVCKGLNMKKINYKHSMIIAAFFGVFQAVMPIIGWFLGIQFKKYISSFSPWVAFVLLAFIGGKMIFETFKSDNKNDAEMSCLNIKELTVLAIATSIDALAVGVTFAFFPNINIGGSIIVIGITTFLISLAGVIIGNNFGAKYQQKAQMAGGIILILIGIKILAEGLIV